MTAQAFGRHLNARQAEGWKFKRSLSQNQEPIRSENVYEYYFSVALIHHESKISGESIALYFEFQ